MPYGNFAYGSVAIGGDIAPAICSAPNANLIVMQQLLEVGYTYEEALRLMNLIN